MLFADKIDGIKNDILGVQYSLSVAYVSEEKSREINKKYRKKNIATNVLSFALRKNAGELVLCKAIIAKEASAFHRTLGQWLLQMVIHGMLHLKGMEHSSTMDKAEKKYREKYDKEYFSGHRRWILGNKGRGG